MALHIKTAPPVGDGGYERHSYHIGGNWIAGGDGAFDGKLLNFQKMGCCMDD